MNLLFVNLSALKFTVQTPDAAPLGGSESALCYLARALVRRGHSVSLIANLPDGTPDSVENIRHYPVAKIRDAAFFASEKFDAIVAVNAPAAAAPLKQLAPSSRLVFWAHALPDQPAMQVLKDPAAKDAVDAAVFVSNWQRAEIERAFGPFRHMAVIGNGIAPCFENMFFSAAELLAAKQNRAAYTATPFRGLAVLLRALQGFDRPVKTDIFSSMQLYQASDNAYADLFAQAAQNPAIVCHGSIAQRELARHLREAAFLFYPCIYPETFCIAVAEAMAAGMKIVSTQLGALPDTALGFASLTPILSNDGDALVHSFREAMRDEVDDFAANPQEWAEKMFEQVRRANEFYTWKTRAEEWEKALSALR